MSNVVVLDWPAPASVKACYTLRTGGGSQPPYSSFNLGDHVGDSSLAVDANRQQLMEILSVDKIAWLQQVHGVDVIDISSCFSSEQFLKADASTTQQKGLACCVMTADCLPVFFCDTDGQQVAMAHAGWRGLLKGVLENTLSAFSANANVMAYLGPAISQAAFEVGDEVRQAFVDVSDELAIYFLPSVNANKWMCDLYGIARQRLLAAGVHEFYGGERCTFNESNAFFSYRREATTGRMAHLIWLE